MLLCKRTPFHRRAKRVMIPRLDRSVCGCSIYTGSLILAWLYTIVCITGSLLCVVMGPIVFSEIDKTWTQEDKEHYKEFLMTMKILYEVTMVVFTVGVPVNVCLLFGIYKKKPCFMLPHLIYAGIMICIPALVTLFSLVALFLFLRDFFQFLLFLIITALAVYHWLILYSHYKTIKEEPALNKITNKF